MAQRMAGAKSPFYIVKPSVGCQGDGITIIQNLDEVPEAVRNEEFIVQEYIDNPLLIEGKKFDLRLYVVMFGVEPMYVYAYREGLVRLCTENYEPVTRENKRNAFMHLTNYSL
jgi:glutathione synthase/RimK-type ligase-like ATP-grasp enzyme